MRLQRRFNRKVGDKVYDKWVVVVPPEAVLNLGWRADLELEVSTKGRTLTLKPVAKHKPIGASK